MNESCAITGASAARQADLRSMIKDRRARKKPIALVMASVPT